MYMLRALFQALVVLPVVALSSCAAGGYITGLGDFNWWGAGIASVIAAVAYLLWTGKQDQARFTKYVSSLGINPEYVACYGDGGIAIDNTNKRLFAGKINKGKVFEFEEISSIESEDDSIGNSMKYMININTMNFDLPKLIIGFAGNQGIRDEAYAKLRAALKIR